MPAGPDEATVLDDPRYKRLKAERDELAQRIVALETRLRERDGSNERAGAADPVDLRLPADVTALLCEAIPALRQAVPEGDTISAVRLIDCFAALVLLMRRLDKTLVTQLSDLGRCNVRIREMAENLDRQRLLDIDGILVKSFAAGTARGPSLLDYCGLMLRWVSAILAGAQATKLDVGNRLRDALDFGKWQVTKGGFFQTEESVYWSYYKGHIRPNLPLKFEDEVKQMFSDKTYEAYGALRNLLATERAARRAAPERGASPAGGAGM